MGLSMFKRWFITLALLLIPISTSCEGLYKSWDSHYLAIKTALQNIPKSFQPKDKPVYIESLSDEEVERSIKYMYGEDIKAEDYWGFYLKRPDMITPLLPLNGSMIILVGHQGLEDETYVVTHEYGHHVFFEICTEDEKYLWLKQWVKEFNEHKLPTEYASVNYREGFAEIFAQYINKTGRCSKEDIKFLDSIGKRLSKSYKGIKADIAVKSTVVPIGTLKIPRMGKTTSCIK